MSVSCPPEDEGEVGGADFQSYLQAIEAGVIELAPRSVVTSRSAAKAMCSTVLPNGTLLRRLSAREPFVAGDRAVLRCHALGWQDCRWVRGAPRSSADHLSLMPVRLYVDSTQQ
jgi:hypothetical protein